MRGISRGEKWILALTAVFLLTVGGWFLLEKNISRPWQVTVVPLQKREARGSKNPCRLR